jgi:hypothetical protein
MPRAKMEPSIKDWDERSAGKRTPRVARQFGIESRFPGPGPLSDRGWRSWKWYATKRQRDSALEQIVKGKNHGFKRDPWIEFRAAER